MRKDAVEEITEDEVTVTVTKKSEIKKISNKKKKRKTIDIIIDWEDKIKAFHGGTVSSYITAAIQEKMIKDNIL